MAATAGGGGDAANAPDVVNMTGGITVSGRTLYGVDAETALARAAKYDYAVERQVRDWVEAMIERRLDGEDIGDALKDGLALCELANKIAPGAVAKTHKGTSKMKVFLELENIKLFLAACRSRFQLREHELFNATDLHQKRDLQAVLTTLQALARYVETLPQFKHVRWGGPSLSVRSSSSRRWAPVDTSVRRVSVCDLNDKDAAELRSRIVELEQRLERQLVENRHLQQQLDSARGASAAAAARRSPAKRVVAALFGTSDDDDGNMAASADLGAAERGAVEAYAAAPSARVDASQQRKRTLALLLFGVVFAASALLLFRNRLMHVATCLASTPAPAL
mmetsp:Transcript_2618/g.6039  ORF Transcript_2618/g.6039 Transcript_2618/m.6039 type:complete len:337 (-) Transcript_2618:82-1092(-)